MLPAIFIAGLQSLMICVTVFNTVTSGSENIGDPVGVPKKIIEFGNKISILLLKKTP